jgi:Flp pilus assembly protein TadD
MTAGNPAPCEIVGDAPAGVEALIRNGRFEEAVVLTERARKNDPLSFNAYVNVATAYRAAGDYDQALAEIRRAFEINPAQTRANFELGVTFMFMGRLNDAIRELETAARGNNPRLRAYLGYAYAAAGRPLDARRILKELQSLARQQYVSSFGIALIHDALGEKEPALAAFEQAYQDRAVEFAQMTQNPPFRTIASEPRYHAALSRVVPSADRGVTSGIRHEYVSRFPTSCRPGTSLGARRDRLPRLSGRPY